MAKYRKISPSIWNDAKFRAFSDDAQLVFFFLLTHPHMTLVGAMRASLPGLASEKGWEEKRFRKGFGEPFAKGMVKHDEEAAFIWLPKFIVHNQPDNPNVIKSWKNAFDLLPECPLYFEMIQALKEYAKGLPKPFAEAFPKGYLNGMANQEQEQEQEIKNPLSPPKKSRRAEHSQKTRMPRDPVEQEALRQKVFCPQLYAWAAQKHLASITLDAEWERFCQKALAHGYRYEDWYAAFQSWLTSPLQSVNGKPPADFAATQQAIIAQVYAEENTSDVAN